MAVRFVDLAFLVRAIGFVCFKKWHLMIWENPDDDSFAAMSRTNFISYLNFCLITNYDAYSF